MAARQPQQLSSEVEALLSLSNRSTRQGANNDDTTAMGCRARLTRSCLATTPPPRLRSSRHHAAAGPRSPEELVAMSRSILKKRPRHSHSRPALALDGGASSAAPAAAAEAVAVLLEGVGRRSANGSIEGVGGGGGEVLPPQGKRRRKSSVSSSSSSMTSPYQLPSPTRSRSVSMRSFSFANGGGGGGGSGVGSRRNSRSSDRDTASIASSCAPLASLCSMSDVEDDVDEGRQQQQQHVYENPEERVSSAASLNKQKLKRRATAPAPAPVTEPAATGTPSRGPALFNLDDISPPSPLPPSRVCPPSAASAEPLPAAAVAVAPSGPRTGPAVSTVRSMLSQRSVSPPPTIRSSRSNGYAANDQFRALSARLADVSAGESAQMSNKSSSVVCSEPRRESARSSKRPLHKEVKREASPLPPRIDTSSPSSFHGATAAATAASLAESPLSALQPSLTANGAAMTPFGGASLVPGATLVPLTVPGSSTPLPLVLVVPHGASAPSTASALQQALQNVQNMQQGLPTLPHFNMSAPSAFGQLTAGAASPTGAPFLPPPPGVDPQLYAEILNKIATNPGEGISTADVLSKLTSGSFAELMRNVSVPAYSQPGTPIAATFEESPAQNLEDSTRDESREPRGVKTEPMQMQLEPECARQAREASVKMEPGTGENARLLSKYLVRGEHESSQDVAGSVSPRAFSRSEASRRAYEKAVAPSPRGAYGMRDGHQRERERPLPAANATAAVAAPVRRRRTSVTQLLIDSEHEKAAARRGGLGVRRSSLASVSSATSMTSVKSAASASSSVVFERHGDVRTRWKATWNGVYTKEERRQKVQRYRLKRVRNRPGHKYTCRQKFAAKRKRVNGRFVTKAMERTMAAENGAKTAAEEGGAATAADSKSKQPEVDAKERATASADAAGALPEGTATTPGVVRATRASARARAAVSASDGQGIVPPPVESSPSHKTSRAEAKRIAVPSSFDSKDSVSRKKSAGCTAAGVSAVRQVGLKPRRVNTRDGCFSPQQQQLSATLDTLARKYDMSLAQSDPTGGGGGKRPRSIGRLTPPGSAASSPRNAALLPPLATLTPRSRGAAGANDECDGACGVGGNGRPAKRARLSSGRSAATAGGHRHREGVFFGGLPLPLNLPSPSVSRQ